MGLEHFLGWFDMELPPAPPNKRKLLLAAIGSWLAIAGLIGLYLLLFASLCCAPATI